MVYGDMRIRPTSKRVIVTCSECGEKFEKLEYEHNRVCSACYAKIAEIYED